MMTTELTLRPTGSVESFSSSESRSSLESNFDEKRFRPATADEKLFGSGLKRTFSRAWIGYAGRDRPPDIRTTLTSDLPTPPGYTPELLGAHGVVQQPHSRNGLTAGVLTEKPLPKTPITSADPTPRQGSFPLLENLPPVNLPEAVEDMSRPAGARANTMDSTTSQSSTQLYESMQKSTTSPFSAGTNGTQSSFASSRQSGQEGDDETREIITPRSGGVNSAAPSPAQPPSAGSGNGQAAPTTSSTHLSGLMCNVHRTTGKEPHALVGATTTILGDKMYVFGGKILSRTRAALTADLYELDLIKRHWTKLGAVGDIPPPRYFHSMCSLGDTKLVCYGGMSPAALPNGQPAPAAQNGQDTQPEVVVMSDIHIYDAPTNTWTYIATQETPQGRYAHCATILPSSATFSSSTAPLSALQHNPSSGNPNQGSIGVNIDGTGGAEMVIVGGQDSANHYIEQISVFNLRSLKWTSTQQLGKSCGAYRSVVAPLPNVVSSRIGKASPKIDASAGGISQEAKEPASSMLIYSNYNFLDVKLELQIRSADGTLTEKPMEGSYTPPGLRFPNGGVIDTNFVVSGTYLTSSKQEYALWALDLRTLKWSRIDAGGTVFSQGSWNRGVLWNRRNTFVILGNRKRSLVEDYNHRRLNFTNVCMVELEAFGLYDNPRKTTPMSGFVSASSPAPTIPLPLPPGAKLAVWNAGGRTLSKAAEELGNIAMSLKELSDMDILAVGGERIPVNSRILARRWGPYFIQLLREGAATQDGNDAATLRPSNSSMSTTLYATSIRNSSLTITNFSSHTSTFSTSMTLAESQSTSTSVYAPSTHTTASIPDLSTTLPEAQALLPTSRPRHLYLPHTHLTIQSLLYYLYTSSLPPPLSPLCSPQILCSLLQLARPYRIDGLLETVVERLHSILDSRNAAAVFNAAAMAAGGGRALRDPSTLTSPSSQTLSPDSAETSHQQPQSATQTTGRTRAGSLSQNPNTHSQSQHQSQHQHQNQSLTSESSLGARDGAGNANSASLRINTSFGNLASGMRKLGLGQGPKSATPNTCGSVGGGGGGGASAAGGSVGVNGTPTALSASGAGAESDDEPGSAFSSAPSSAWGDGEGGGGRGSGDGKGAGGAVEGGKRGSGANGKERQVWRGDVSAVIGLQKRGLRGLMEGRRLRERGMSARGRGEAGGAGQGPQVMIPVQNGQVGGVGLGIT